MNKKEKISVLISIVLISLLAIGAVSAADDVAVDDDLGLSAADEIQAVDDTQINDEIIQEPDIVEETQATEGDSSTTGDDTLRDEPTKTFSDLRSDIGEDSSEVTLEGTYKFDPNEDNSYPIIRRDLTITGPATIDGNGLTRLFAVTSGTLTLRNLTLINGATNQTTLNGAGIFAQGGSLDIQGCTFRNNVAYQHAGAVRVEGGSLIVKDSVFEENTAGRQGSALSAIGTATGFEVINCTFKNNEASTIGVIDTAVANSRIIDSNFTSNSAPVYGGAICLRGANSIVKNSVFNNNIASEGGAIRVYGARNCEIEGCTFISNTGSNGGAIYTNGENTIVKDSVFKENIGTGGGGSAIYVSAVNSTISNCIFDSNIVPSASGVANYAAVYLFNLFSADVNSVISKCIFVNNSALRGSAITSYQNNFVVEESIFLDNIATEGEDPDYPMATDIFLQDNELPITYSINKIWFGNTVDNYTASLQTYNKSYEKWQGFANVHVGNWYFLDLEATTGSSYYDLLISLNNLYTNDTGEVTKVTDCGLPNWNVSLSATKGTVTPTQVTLENGIAHAQYELTAAQGPATITANALGPKVSKELPGISVKENVVVTTSSETVTVSYPETGSITITASAPGTYTVHVGENVYSAVIETAGGSATVTVPKLPAGSYDVSVTAPETEEYNAVDTGKIATYTVNKGTVSITSANVTVAYPSTDSVTITASVAGEYTLTVGDKTYPAVIAEDGGSASIPIDQLAVGDYGISVSGSAGDNYYPIDTGIINYYHVIAGSITVTGQGTTVTYPDKGTFLINTNVAGAYTITIGDKTYDATFDVGVNQFNVPEEFNAGDYDIKVSESIPNYEAITGQLIGSYTVKRAASSVSVDPITFVYDTSGSATAILDGATGFTAGIANYPEAVTVEGSTITVSGLPAGNYTMLVITEPDENHYAVSINVDVTVEKAGSSIYVDSINKIYGESVTVEVTLVNATGFTAFIADYEEATSIDGNMLTVSGLPVGTHLLMLRTINDENHKVTACASTVTVDKATPKVTLTAAEGSSIRYGESLTLIGRVDPADAGEVTYWLNGAKVDSEVPRLDPGEYTFVAKVAGSANYNAAESDPLTITVFKATPTISVTVDPVKYGEHGDVVVSLTGVDDLPLAGFTVNVKVNEKNYTGVTDANGVAHISIDILPVSEYTVAVDTVETEYYYSVGDQKYLDVRKADLNITAGTSAPSVVYGNEISFTYDIKTPEGTTTAGGQVTYIVDGNPIDSSSISTLAAGPHTVVAKYSGDDYFNEALSDPVGFTVTKAAPIIRIDSVETTYPNIALLGVTVRSAAGTPLEGISLKVTVNGVDYERVTDSTGQALIPIDGLNAGEYPISAVSVGNENYTDGTYSGDAKVIVNKADATVTLTADKYEITFGESVTLTAIVSPSDATGPITYYVDGVEVESNVLSNLAAGNRIVSAKYAGDDNYNWAAGGPTTIHVNKADSTVSVDPISFAYGASGSATATLTGATGFTATIEGHPEAVAVEGNVITVSGLPVGTYTMVVTTVPDANHNAVSINVPVGVGKEDATVALSADKEVIDFGETVTLDAVVSPEDATGPITYYVNDVAVDSKVLSGLAAGTYTVHAMYGGDDNYNAAVSNRITITVNPVASTVSVDPISFTYGDSGTATATLTGATGFTATIEGFENAVKVNGNEITVSGLPANANAYTMVVTTVPDANHTAVSINVEVTVNKADATVTLTADKYEITFGESVTLNAALSPSDATGPITYYVDGVEVESNVLSNLAAGVRVVTAKYAGDENYNEAVGGPTTITVNKAPSTVKVDPINFAYGAVGTATATLTGATDFTATIDGYPNAVTINGNEITVSGLPSGSYTMVVTTVPDANHTEATIDVPVGVGKEDAAVALSADKEVIDFGETVTLTAVVSPDDATGPITYYVNDELVDSNVLSGLAAGTYTVYAQYAGDDNYNAANSNSISITVNKVASTVAVDPISFTYGGSGTATATLTGAETVTATIAGYPDAVSVAGAVITVSGLPAGNYIMVVTTVPDASHTEASINVAVAVEKATPAISISASKDAYAYGEDAVLEVTVMDGETGVTGSAIVTIGDNKYLVDVTDGSGKLTVKGLSNGTYEATAKFLANDNYNAAEALEPASIVISASTDAVITASVSEPNADGEATLTVNVVDGAGNPVTGKVNVTVGDGEPQEVDVTEGAASIPLTGLALGENTIVVSTNEYTADPVTLTAVVPPKNTAEVSVSTEDGNIVIEAKDGSTPLSGTATVVIDGGEPITVTVDDTGKATVPMDGLAPGQHTVEVTFANDNYEPVSEVATISVPKGTATVSISASKNEFAYGEDVVLNVAVMDGETGVAGTVIVTVGGNDYAVTVGADGTGQAVIKGLADNSYQATAKFVGNDNYEEASAASAASFVVNAPPEKLVPTLTITVDPVSIKESESATIKVSLVYEDTKLDGIVIVSIDGTDYAVNVVDGEGSITVNNLDPNTYPIKGEFIGDDVYAKVSVDDQTLEVTKVAKVSLNVTSVGENIVIQLTDEDNNPVTGKVNVTIDGSTKEVDVNNGVATVPIGEGNHNVTVSYPGDDIHTGAQSVSNIVYVKKSSAQKIKTQIVVNKNQTITYNKKLDNRSNYYVYATLKDANGNILAGKTVTFFAHKKLYVTKTNSKGQFRFCIAHVGYGECTHALTFVGDEDYEESFAVVCVTIKKQKVKLTSKARTFKATKKVKKLTATLKNSKGKAIAGKKITFTVNGKKYTAKTNSKGVATVKIKVTKKKTYKVKVTFAGDKTYAKKTVNRKLKII